jgi:tRNA threonylcarbamoyl adenosine modification protein (Sua5/YciO/YrdC/YwlC family)
MAVKIKLHPKTPHVKRVFEIVDYLRREQIVLLPVDTGYAIACSFSSKKAVERIKQIRRLDKKHHFTVLSKDLAQISDLGFMDNNTFKVVKKLIPAPITFILKATKVVPKLLVDKKKQTIGIRVPNQPISQEILAELNEPLFVTTAKLPDTDLSVISDPDLFQRSFDSLVDVIVDDEQEVKHLSSSVVDLSAEPARIIREGESFNELNEVLYLSQLNYEYDAN